MYVYGPRAGSSRGWVAGLIKGEEDALRLALGRDEVIRLDGQRTTISIGKQRRPGVQLARAPPERASHAETVLYHNWRAASAEQIELRVGIDGAPEHDFEFIGIHRVTIENR